MVDARNRIGPDLAVQGNVDPIVLFTDKETIYAAVDLTPSTLQKKQDNDAILNVDVDSMQESGQNKGEGICHTLSSASAPDSPGICFASRAFGPPQVDDVVRRAGGPGAKHVTESARARTYILSKEVQKAANFGC